MADIGIAEDVADFGALAAGQEDAQGFGMQLETIGIRGPGFLDRLGYRESLLGVGDGGLEQVLPGQLAVALVHLGPAFDAPGHGEAVDAGGRHRLDALLGEELRREGFGGGAGGIQPGELAGPGSQYMTNRSPPRPFFIGSTTASTALAAMAASTADPPLASICAAGRGRQRLAGGGDSLLRDHHGAAVIAALRRTREPS